MNLNTLQRKSQEFIDPLKSSELLVFMNTIKHETDFSTLQLQQLTDLFGMSSVVIDMKGKILSINKKAAETFGYKSEELIGTEFKQHLAAAEEDLQKILIHDDNTNNLESFNLILIGRSGRKISMSVIPIFFGKDNGVTDSIFLGLTVQAKPVFQNSKVQHQEIEFQHFANRLIVAHEIELKRISSELHDGIGQVLATIKFMVEDASRRLASGDIIEAENLLSDTVKCARDATNEVRRLSNELWPSTLTHLGLIATIERHCRKYKSAYEHISLAISLKVDERKIHEKLKSEIFHIIQEAMTNIAKHSEASVISISLINCKGSLLLNICDNGKGFDSSNLIVDIDGLEGIGLRSMRERVESSGGDIKIHSSSKKGTAIDVKWRLGINSADVV